MERQGFLGEFALKPFLALYGVKRLFWPVKAEIEVADDPNLH